MYYFATQLFFFLVLTIHTKANHILSRFQKNNELCEIEGEGIIKLRTLHMAGVEASKSLCRDLNMTKCGKLCCLDQKAQEEMPQILQKEYCKMTDEQICLKHCWQASSHIKQYQSRGYYHIRHFTQNCSANIGQLQSECRSAGLLWCDGNCCGFSSPKHKCFKVNHYGLPYIRCPIEDN